VDNGADISSVKSQKLLGTTEFEPRDRVQVKGVDGSTLETHGSIEARIQVGGLEIPYSFQLESHQIYLRGDEILSRDFLKVWEHPHSHLPIHRFTSQHVVRSEHPHNHFPTHRFTSQ